ncbi:MAG: hypothetical protein J3K34DRAFT_457460, partial [Monoraphidium minutum]
MATGLGARTAGGPAPQARQAGCRPARGLPYTGGPSGRPSSRLEALRWEGGGRAAAAASEAAAAAAPAAPNDWGHLPLSVLLPNGHEFEVTWLISREDGPPDARPPPPPAAAATAATAAATLGAAPRAAGAPAAVLPLAAFVEERRRQLQWHRQLREQLERQLSLDPAPRRRGGGNSIGGGAAAPPGQKRSWDEFRGLLPAVCAARDARALAALVLPAAPRLKAAAVSYALQRLCAVSAAAARAPAAAADAAAAARGRAPGSGGGGSDSSGAARNPSGGGGGGGGGGGAAHDAFSQTEARLQQLQREYESRRRRQAACGAAGGAFDGREGPLGAHQQQEEEDEEEAQEGAARLPGEEEGRRVEHDVLLALLQRSRQLRGAVPPRALAAAARAAEETGFDHPGALAWLAAEAERQLFEADDDPDIAAAPAPRASEHTAEAAAITVCHCCERLGAPRASLRAELLRRALAAPRAAAARLPLAVLLRLASLAGAAGAASPELGAAICRRVAAGGALRLAPDRLALLCASMARLGGGGAPAGWSGALLAPAALWSLASGRRGWGARRRLAQLRVILDSAAACEMPGREEMARQLVASLAEWAALDAWRPPGAAAEGAEGGAATAGGSAFERRDRLRRELYGRRGAALLCAMARCGAPPPPPLLNWLLRRCAAPALHACDLFWVQRLGAALAGMGGGAGLLLSAALGPWLHARQRPQAEDGGGDDGSGGGGGGGGERVPEIDLWSGSAARLLLAVGYLSHQCQREEAGADADAMEGGEGLPGAALRRPRPSGSAAARAFALRALAALPRDPRAARRAAPARHAAVLAWAAARAGAAPSGAQRRALRAALAGRLRDLPTAELVRFAWAAAALELHADDGGVTPSVGADGADGDDGSEHTAPLDEERAGAAPPRPRRQRPLPPPPPFGGRAFADGLARELAGRRLDGASAATALWALSRLGDAPGARRAFLRLAEHAVAAEGGDGGGGGGGGGGWELDAASVVKLATACAQASWAPPALLGAAAARGAALAPRMGGPLLAQLVWATAAARVAHRPLLAAAAARAGEIADAHLRSGGSASGGGGGVSASDGGGGASTSGGGGFTSSRQPEALLQAWADLGYEPTPAAAAALRRVAAELRRREGGGRGGGERRESEGGGERRESEGGGEPRATPGGAAPAEGRQPGARRRSFEQGPSDEGASALVFAPPPPAAAAAAPAPAGSGGAPASAPAPAAAPRGAQEAADHVSEVSRRLAAAAARRQALRPQRPSAAAAAAAAAQPQQQEPPARGRRP